MRWRGWRRGHVSRASATFTEAGLIGLQLQEPDTHPGSVAVKGAVAGTQAARHERLLVEGLVLERVGVVDVRGFGPDAVQ